MASNSSISASYDGDGDRTRKATELLAGTPNSCPDGAGWDPAQFNTSDDEEIPISATTSTDESGSYSKNEYLPLKAWYFFYSAGLAGTSPSNLYNSHPLLCMYEIPLYTFHMHTYIYRNPTSHPPQHQASSPS